MDAISFPGLNLWDLPVPINVFQIGSFRVTWYGVLIAAGLLLAMLYGMKRAKDFNITVDDLTDVLIFSLIFAIIGARLYYVVFDPHRATNYTSFLSVVSIWNGGLGIYGGIIFAFITAFIVCKIKKISSGAMFDIAALGFLIGQAIGRWGNFFNQEAYGAPTKLPWGMKIYDYITANAFVTVHPCFLYESLWCVLGFILLHNYSKKYRKFNGEIFLMYVMWYGFGRFFIEGLRTDSLLIGATIKVSQLVAVVSFIAALVLYIIKRNNLRINGSADEYTSVYDEAAKALIEQDSEIEERQHSGLDSEDEDDGEEEDDDNEVFLDDEPDTDCSKTEDK
jgi:phosphatidylglycerol:prolipoprotein diacylglycerol transferase